MHLRATPNYFGKHKISEIRKYFTQIICLDLAKAQFVSLVCTIWGSAMIAFHAQNCPTKTETDSKEEQEYFMCPQLAIERLAKMHFGNECVLFFL